MKKTTYKTVIAVLEDELKYADFIIEDLHYEISELQDLIKQLAGEMEIRVTNIENAAKSYIPSDLFKKMEAAAQNKTPTPPLVAKPGGTEPGTRPMGKPAPKTPLKTTGPKNKIAKTT